MRSPLALIVVLALSTLAPRAHARPVADDAEFFERNVRPLLVEHCLKCHGDEKPKGGLRLTSRAAILEGGDSGPAAEAGKPDESLLVHAVRYLDEPKMPPKAKLSDADIATLARWVESGLAWPEASSAPSTAAAPSGGFQITDEQRAFWSFRPIAAPIPPDVRAASWPSNVIDRFILAKLEQQGLSPAPISDKHTLIRRATFDLLGVPPTPEDVSAFLNDDSPDAFARVVDRLLASPMHGQRWARHWLDVVRYADSLDTRGSGQPGDILDAWRYRDWVVDAINADLSYDQFVRAQIAGDIPARTDPDDYSREGTIATTMLAIGNWGNGDADKEKILTDIADDQVDVVSKAFLGLTVACARCHDHKFDPISQRDYYALAGIFFSTHILPKLTPKGAGETIIRVPLASPGELTRRAEREAKIDALTKSLADLRGQHYGALARAVQPEAHRYLLATHDYLTAAASGPSAPSLAEFAAQHNLLPYALRQWVDLVGGGETNVLPNRAPAVGGVNGVLAWNGSPAQASATANTTDIAQQILTFRLPPRSVSVHPGPASAAVIAWTSPVAGRVRATGRIADSDPAGGNGVAWTIQKRTRDGAAELASGDLANGASMAFAQGKNADALASVKIEPGDRLEVIVLPKGDYTCDTTTVDLVVSSWETADTWDLTRDTLTDFHAGNPIADRLGHAATWTFADAPRPRDPGNPLTTALDNWRARAAAAIDRAALERAAQELAPTLPLDGETSPFWIKQEADEASLPAPARDALAAMRRELQELQANPPAALDFANAAQEGGVPESTHAGAHDVSIHHRGRYDRLGEPVARGFPTILGGGPDTPITKGSGRAELARWITRPENPLTARVIVNRLWQQHFGAGLVRTPSNFGKLGDRPTHAELLDYLASALIQQGWSLKRLQREIMLSSTYQQSSTPSADALAGDADNRLFSRQNRRRLEAEAIRDHLLAASGRLDPAFGGPAIRDPAIPRRGLYVVTIRSDRTTFAALFDQADSTAPADIRVESTVAPQALYLLNNPLIHTQARALADRLAHDEPHDASARIGRAYQLLFARPPTEQERSLARDLLASGESDRDAWTAYCHMLLCSNEFLYVD